MKTRIAYIGAGGFTNGFMFPQLDRHEVALAAVCDLKEEKALAAQKKFGFEKVYTDFRKMLDEVKPQAVFCVGGPQVHHAVGLEVLDRGLPLYIQKPPAPSSQATRALAALAAKKKVVCHVGFNLRFSTAGVQAKAIIGSPEFGVPLMGIFRYGLCSAWTMADVVMDQHCHLVDTARFLLGEIAEVAAKPSGRSGARDYVAALRFASGAVGTLNFTSRHVTDKDLIYFEISAADNLLFSHGALASLTWQRALNGPWWKNPTANDVFEHGPLWFDFLEGGGYVGDVDNYLAAVRGTAPDLSPIASAIGTMEICEELLRQISPPLV